MSTENKHHKWSPSKWPGFSQCLAYKSSDKSTEHAYRGQLQHSYLEALGTDNKEEKLRLEMLLSAQEIENVMFVYGRVRDAIAASGGSFEIFYEQRFVALGKHFQPIPGHADIVILTPSEVWVIDAKFGAMKDYDPQLIVYCLGAMQKYNRSNARFYLLYGQEKTFTTGETNLVDAMNFFNSMVEKLIAAEKNPESVVPTMCGWCQYCGNNTNCGAFMNKINEIAVVADVKYEAPTQIDIKTCPIEQLDKLNEALAVFAKFGESVKETLKERIQNGEKSTTYKLQSKSGATSIKSIYDLSSKIAEKTGKPISEVEHSLLGAGKFSLTGVRSFLYGTRSEEKAIKDEFETNFGTCLVQGAPTESLVKLSAKDLKELADKSKGE